MLIDAGALDTLLACLDRAITEGSYLPMLGQIVDATLVAAPRQRNSEGEEAAIKAGKTAAEIWPKKPAKARQKDVDARWTLKVSKAKPANNGTPRMDIAIPRVRLQVAHCDRPPARHHPARQGQGRGRP